MDFNQSEELSERLKRATAAQFPGIIEEEKQIGPDGQPIEQQQGESPEDMAAIMRDFANLQQENEQLKQQLGQIDVESMKLNQADTHKQMEIDREGQNISKKYGSGQGRV
jgi:regulator of replication initiation timing